MLSSRTVAKSSRKLMTLVFGGLYTTKMLISFESGDCLIVKLLHSIDVKSYVLWWLMVKSLQWMIAIPPPVLLVLGMEMALYPGGDITMWVMLSSGLIQVSISAQISSLQLPILSWIACVLLTIDLQLTSPQCMLFCSLFAGNSWTVLHCILMMFSLLNAFQSVILVCVSLLLDTMVCILWNNFFPPLNHLYFLGCDLIPSAIIHDLVDVSREKSE